MKNWTTIGHNSNKKYFENLIEKGILSHAYVFFGSDWVDKKSFAYDLFRLVNGREPLGDPDFKLITPRLNEDETKIYVEDIRELKSFLSLKSYFGHYKFVVINDADRMVTQASNSFLKMLEEPSPFSVIILITSKLKFILPTVLSRCEKIHFLSSAERELDPIVKNSVNEFLKISKEGICERMQYAEKIFNENNYQAIIVGLIHTFRQQGFLNFKILKNLLRLNSLLSQPQFNHRLALENFMINLS